MKLLKTRSNPILKNVDVNWYGKIHLKILKKKTHKVHKNKTHLNISIMYLLGTKNLINEKN
jgi:hypothetical protein